MKTINDNKTKRFSSRWTFVANEARGQWLRVRSIKILYTDLKKRRSDASRWYRMVPGRAKCVYIYILEPVKIKDELDKYLSPIMMNNLRRWTGKEEFDCRLLKKLR